MSQLREADVHAETLRRGEQEGGHSCPPNVGLENPPSVGDVAQTELGRLPADWRVGRFDSLFDVQQGRQVSKKNRIGDNQRPFLRTKNVFWNRLDLSDLDEMHFSEADESRLALKPDDLLICEGGDIGRTAIWRGIILFLNKAKPKERQGKLFLLNAGRDFTKGDPKNFIPDDAILRIAETFAAWKEVEKYSRIVSREEIAKNDFNISPSRYIHTGAGEEYRPVVEIVEELEGLESEATETNAALKTILAQIQA